MSTESVNDTHANVTASKKPKTTEERLESLTRNYRILAQHVNYHRTKVPELLKKLDALGKEINARKDAEEELRGLVRDLQNELNEARNKLAEAEDDRLYTLEEAREFLREHHIPLEYDTIKKWAASWRHEDGQKRGPQPTWVKRAAPDDKGIPHYRGWRLRDYVDEVIGS